jgi:predicted MFS family arabinose efflux permease
MNANQPAASCGMTMTSFDGKRSWLAVLSIALGSFAFVTTEYMPVGVLPKIAADLGITPGLIAAISAPLLLLASGRVNRRVIIVSTDT